MREDHSDRTTLLGLLIVYVDDFLLEGKEGEMRDSFLGALGAMWTLAKQEVLSVSHPITFLGIDMSWKCTFLDLCGPRPGTQSKMNFPWEFTFLEGK